MSTDHQPTPATRPLPEGPRGPKGPRRPWREIIIEQLSSVRQLLLIAGSGSLLLGVIVVLFFGDLRQAGQVVMLIGLVLLIASAAIGWRQVSRFVFGRRGLYGANTVVIVVAIVALAAIVNYSLVWLTERPNPMPWLRWDATATQQFALSDQATKLLADMNEPVRVTAFFTDTSVSNAAWRTTQDLLSEFRRRSTTHPFEYRRIDPDLDPNIAAEYGVNRYPAIAVEGMESRRTEVIYGQNPRDTRNVFSEQQIVTGMLVVNQISQKTVLFIGGHSGRDVTSTSRGDAYGLAFNALLRENYRVNSATLQELGTALASNDPRAQPAAIIFADPRGDLAPGEQNIVLEYMRRGGSMLVLLEPDPPESFLNLLARWGVAVGDGELADVASYVAPNPLFLQVKNTNGQIPAHPITTDFDVLYFPGATYLASTVSPDTVPVTDTGQPYVNKSILSTTTLQSWAETDPDSIFYSPEKEPGPLPIAIVVEAISELASQPRSVDGEFVKSNMVIIGDADFASNNLFASARNGDLFVNSVNWLVRDYELISIRPKVEVTRELVLTSRQREFVRWSGWLLMPGLIGAAGIWAWWRRR